MKEQNEDWPCKTPRAELVQKALDHYNEISNQACHWVGLIPEAIRTWGELKDGETVAGLRAERDTALAGVIVANAAMVEALRRIKEIEARVDKIDTTA